jgi:hypothetical protein
VLTPISRRRKMKFDTVELLVRRPPATNDEAMGLA